MLPRPFSCEKCRSTFRTPTGREWHIAHRHDVPITLHAIKTEYEANLNTLEVSNRELTSQNNQLHYVNLKELLRTADGKIEVCKLEIKCQLLERQQEALKIAIELYKTAAASRK
jgi:hypothetical protein